MFRIAHLLFVPTSTSHYSTSITLRYASAIVYTSMAYCTFNCISVDSYSSFTTMFSSLASICTNSTSTKCCFSTSSSSDCSMHTRSIDVAPSLVCSLAWQRHLLLHKNSILDVLVVFMF